MRHTTTQSTETVSDITCDVCGRSTSVEGFGCQYGTLQAHWGYGSKHDGERYEVHLCESCFFGTLGMLRRDRMVNTMFDEGTKASDETFGLVGREDFSGER